MADTPLPLSGLLDSLTEPGHCFKMDLPPRQSRKTSILLYFVAPCVNCQFTYLRSSKAVSRICELISNIYLLLLCSLLCTEGVASVHNYVYRGGCLCTQLCVLSAIVPSVTYRKGCLW